MRYTPGICFICKEACDIESYCHHECAVAYSDRKEQLIKETVKTIGIPKKELKDVF